MRYRLLIFLGLAATATSSAQTLHGSPASVDLMYTSARSEDLQFFNTPDDIYRAAVQGALSLISVTEDLELDEATFPFVLPNTKRFADSLAHEYHAACGERLVVTSGARPLDDQPRNASPKSVHPTGMAVDFRKPRTPACLAWLRSNLVALEDRHVVEATEERHPAHFHVAVLRQGREPRITTVAASGEVAPSAPDSAGGRRPGRDVDHTSRAHAYRVKAGDNLWTIAHRTGTTPQRIQALNHLTGSRIRPGQTLTLP
jgi:hypothetical protein